MQFWADWDWWLALGVINNISKDKVFQTIPSRHQVMTAVTFTNGPHVHEYIHEMYERVFGPNNFVTVDYHQPQSRSDLIIRTQNVKLSISVTFTNQSGLRSGKSGYEQYRLSDLTDFSQWQAWNGSWWWLECIILVKRN